MKSLEEVLNSNPVFLENWSNVEGVYADFSNGNRWNDNWTPEKDLTDYKVLFAYYGHESYEGYAFVLASKDGKLYEVNGSHCSCYGLEGQWSPEEAFLPELFNRVTKGEGYLIDSVKDDLRIFLGIPKSTKTNTPND